MEIGPGAKIKNYELKSLIGRGASGEVWLAQDAEKPVAIKFMNEHLLHSKSAAKHRERLEREVNAMKVLAHPNIPALYDYDLDAERPYMVMQYLDTPTYDQLISTGDMLRIPIERRLGIIHEVAQALTTAHQKGIIHRDIKPSNISGVDTPYLLDFSIALLTENRELTNVNVGTAIYMTPDGAAPDELGDSYSFALVAYEILFGRHPIFDYNDRDGQKGAFTRIQAFNRLKDEKWRIPSKLGPEELPPELAKADLAKLDEIFGNALGPREKRYKDLIAFANELRAAVLTPENVKALGTLNATTTAQEIRFQQTPQPIPQEEQFTLLETTGNREQMGIPPKIEPKPAETPAPAAASGGFPLPLPVILGGVALLAVIAIVLFVLASSGGA